MNASKQEQQQSVKSAADQPYEWSYIRVAEATVTNVVSAAIISAGALVVGLIYAGWLLLLNVWHAPAGLVGILAFILLGAMLMLIVLGFVIVAWFRHMNSATLAGMLIGAMVGAAIGAAIDTGKWKVDASIFTKAQEQTNAAKTESKQSDEQ